MAEHEQRILDLRQVVIVTAQNLNRIQQQAVELLIEECEKRTHIRLKQQVEQPGSSTPVIVAAVLEQVGLPSLGITADLVEAFRGAETAARPEGFQIRVVTGQDQPAVYVIGNDNRGLMYGIGYLLRKLRMAVGHNGAPGILGLPAGLQVQTAPAYPLRGHQLGYRAKANSYDGWDVAQWEQYYRDLIVFGTNAVELIPPRSDDDSDSVHFSRPPDTMMQAMSRLAGQYNLDVWIWFPAMEDDYNDPSVLEAAVQEWRSVFENLPRIDSVFVPGGDPGHTHPRDLMILLEKQKQLLNSYHPAAKMWVSPQGFTSAWMDEFLKILNHDQPAWLDGVVFGPWIHVSMAVFRQQIPARYAIRSYPDITHCLNCQFPVPEWDLALALTLGREPINPRPQDQAAIFKLYQPGTVGFLTYSEGCNDDVNKCIWSGLGWDPDARLIDLLRDYSRYFIGDAYSDNFAQGLLALERNWRGPLAYNTGVYATLQQFQEMESQASPFVLKNWRFQQALYRAYYDAFVRSRLLYETGLEEQAMDQLRQAELKGSFEAMAQAEQRLDEAVNRPISTAWRTRLFQLAEALFQSIAMQLDTKLFKGQHTVRGANLDAVDTPLNNRPWLKACFQDIRKLESETDRLARIHAIVHYTNPGAGGRYTDLGNSVVWEPVRRGEGFNTDPAGLRSAMRRFAYQADPRPVRYSWHGFTGGLAEVPLQLHYENLDPDAQYRVRVVYSPIERSVPLLLEANGIQVHPSLIKADPNHPLEFDIPPAATQSGDLLLTLSREPGRGRGGTGADISEIWLMKK